MTVTEETPEETPEDSQSNDNDHTEYDPGQGCRPCCSNPHGARHTIVAAFLTTLAFSLSIATMASCHYLTPNFTYCFPSYSWKPGEDETLNCMDFNEDDVGLFGYEGFKEGGGLFANINPLPGWFESYEQEHMKGLYEKCYFYSFRNAQIGFWYEVKELFGAGHLLASIFSGLGAVAGLVAGFLGWTTCCVAFRRAAFVAITVISLLAGLFELLTLVFFASGICEYGCTLREGGIFAICSAIIFFLSAILWYVIPRYDKTQVPIQCCCCPQFHEERSGGITEVELQRTYLPDGSVVTQQTTISTSGFKSVVRTTCLPDVRIAGRTLGKEDTREENGAWKSETVEEDEPLLSSFTTAASAVS